MDETDFQINQVRLLVSRLERISADSVWARRASGIRGALLKWLEEVDLCTAANDEGIAKIHKNNPNLQLTINLGYQILEKAAKERLR